MSSLEAPSQQTLLPADICIQALVAAGGNTRLAAERLFGSDPNATSFLTASIAQDPLATQRLNEQLRVLTTLQAYDALNSAKVLLDGYLTDLDPEDFVKFYASLLDQVAKLTAPPPTGNAGPQLDAARLAEMLMAKMPPHIRGRFLELVGGGPVEGPSSAPALPQIDLEDEAA